VGYHGQFFFDLMEISLKRLSFALAQDLAPKGVAAVAIAPGFMRTEAILEQFGATEATWRDAAENNPKAKSWGFVSSETPCFVGRGIAALAADPNRIRKSGGILSSWALAEEYGLTDLDGTRPNMPRYMQEHFPGGVRGSPPIKCAWLWRRREACRRGRGRGDQPGDFGLETRAVARLERFGDPRQHFRGVSRFWRVDEVAIPRPIGKTCGIQQRALGAHQREIESCGGGAVRGRVALHQRVREATGSFRGAAQAVDRRGRA